MIQSLINSGLIFFFNKTRFLLKSQFLYTVYSESMCFISFKEKNISDPVITGVTVSF